MCCVERARILNYTPNNVATAQPYMGRIRLSFWAEKASSRPVKIVAIEYGTGCTRQLMALHRTGSNLFKLTLKLRTIPNAHRNMVDTRTLPTNATLPSSVLPPAAHHLTLPTRRPTIEACMSAPSVSGYWQYKET